MKKAMDIKPVLGLDKYGVTIRRPTVIGTWDSKKPVIVETPVQLRGGRINIEEIGAFSYLGAENSYFQNVKKIGRFCAFGPSVRTGYAEHSTESLSPHPMFAWKFDSNWKESLSLYDDDEFIVGLRNKINRSIKRNSPIEIGNDVWIGNGAYISKGVKIGDGAIIAAHAVVVKDVPPYTIVGGVPAKPIRQRYDDHKVEKLLELKWWDYGPEILKNVDITDVEAAIYEIEERISKGIPKFIGNKVEFNPVENAIFYISGNDGNRQLISRL